MIDPRRKQTSRGADPDRAAGLKPEGKVIGTPIGSESLTETGTGQHQTR